ncbi:YqaA family protein [Aliidiomarina celeris]|uniref:YqaA family protein n=1 Tax=Aliidiomarina celeris TaxID=2249428 RepID=UPI000DEB46AF|nr:YqaA family protein [Aliidiomarina celeris]
MQEYFAEFGYAGLFVAAFLAATILPLSSEIVLTGLLLAELSPYSLVAVATVGNVLGSLTNYAFGFWAGRGGAKRWLGVSEHDLLKAEQRFGKYGMLSLCFAWVPIIGDPLTVLAGVLRVPLKWFVILVTAGKFLRYALITSTVLHL